MLAFMGMLREKYGGAEGYAQNVCGLSVEDVQVIRRNLVVKAKL